MPEHERAFKKWKMLEMTLNKCKSIDSKLKEPTMKERQIWRQVLTRLLELAKFLTKQNLVEVIEKIM